MFNNKPWCYGETSLKQSEECSWLELAGEIEKVLRNIQVNIILHRPGCTIVSCTDLGRSGTEVLIVLRASEQRVRRRTRGKVPFQGGGITTPKTQKNTQ